MTGVGAGINAGVGQFVSYGLVTGFDEDVDAIKPGLDNILRVVMRVLYHDSNMASIIVSVDMLLVG